MQEKTQGNKETYRGAVAKGWQDGSAKPEECFGKCKVGAIS